MWNEIDSCFNGSYLVRYRGGTERNEVTSSNAMVPSVGLLDGSNTAFTLSNKYSLTLSGPGIGGPFAQILTLYRGQMHATDLTHMKDTTVSMPRESMCKANTVPSLPKAMICRLGEPIPDTII